MTLFELLSSINRLTSRSDRTSQYAISAIQLYTNRVESELLTGRLPLLDFAGLTILAPERYGRLKLEYSFYFRERCLDFLDTTLENLSRTFWVEFLELPEPPPGDILVRYSELAYSSAGKMIQVVRRT